MLQHTSALYNGYTTYYCHLLPCIPQEAQLGSAPSCMSVSNTLLRIRSRPSFGSWHMNKSVVFLQWRKHPHRPHPFKSSRLAWYSTFTSTFWCFCGPLNPPIQRRFNASLSRGPPSDAEPPFSLEKSKGRATVPGNRDLHPDEWTSKVKVC